MKLERIDGHRHKKHETDVGHRIEPHLVDLEFAGEISDVAHDSRHDHRADVGRQRNELTEVVTDDRTQSHADGYHAARFEKLFGKGRMFGRMLVNNVRLDFFGNIELGSHFRIGHRGAHFVLANQPFAERTADRESRHHTERCGCHRHHRAARNTVKLLEVRPECCRRAQTTHHRDGTGEQPVMKINAHELGNRYTEHILKHGEHSHGNQKAQQKLAALPDQLEAGHHADRGKES